MPRSRQGLGGIVQGSGKEARITIGAFGVFTTDQARDAAREHLRTMRLGGDPAPSPSRPRPLA